MFNKNIWIILIIIFVNSFAYFAYADNFLPMSVLEADRPSDYKSKKEPDTIKTEDNLQKQQSIEDFIERYGYGNTEENQNMNREFDRFIKKEQKPKMYILAGINEYTSESGITESFGLGTRFTPDGKSLLFNAPHVYPVAYIGSKGISLSASYAVLDLPNFKFYIDSVMPFIHFDSNISLGTGMSFGYYGKKYGLEFAYKHLWNNPVEEDDKDYSDFWGLFLVYKY